MGWFDDNREEENTKKKSEDFQKKYAPDTQDAPVEKGLEEETTPFDMLGGAKRSGLAQLREKGYISPTTELAADAIIPDSPLFIANEVSKGLKGASKLARMMRPAKSASKLSEVPKVMREAAIMNPEKLAEINKDVDKAKEVYSAEKKANLYGAQAQKDVAEGIKPAGLGKDAAPYKGDLVADIKKEDASRIEKLRNSGPDMSSAYAKAPIEEAGTTMKYANPKDYRISLKQERMSLDPSKEADRVRLKAIDAELEQLSSPVRREY